MIFIILSYKEREIPMNQTITPFGPSRSRSCRLEIVTVIVVVASHRFFLHVFCCYLLRRDRVQKGQGTRLRDHDQHSFLIFFFLSSIRDWVVGSGVKFGSTKRDSDEVMCLVTTFRCNGGKKNEKKQVTKGNFALESKYWISRSGTGNLLGPSLVPAGGTGDQLHAKNYPSTQLELPSLHRRDSRRNKVPFCYSRSLL